jgi:hypothetical protein
MALYLRQTTKKLDIKSVERDHPNIQVSLLEGMTLSHYVDVRMFICERNHYNCSVCQLETEVCKYILNEQPVKLTEIWRKFYPQMTYGAYSATKKLGRFPVVFVSLPEQLLNSSAIYIIEKERGVDYGQLMHTAEKLGLLKRFDNDGDTISKDRLKLLQLLASSEKDRKLIQYAATSHLSGTVARRHYGVTGHQLRCTEV